jgi:probable HAF family extracellular repeat protein
MSAQRNWVILGQDGPEELVPSPATHPDGLTRSQLGRSGLSARLIPVLSASVALWTAGCTSRESPTEPLASASSARGPARAYTALDLGTLGGDFSLARDVNSAGQVVGISLSADGRGHAFLWEKGVMTDLGSLPGGVSGIATGINPRGQVVGNIPGVEMDDQRAFLWENGAMITLGALDGGTFSEAVDINPAGQVVGWSYVSGGSAHAFLWEKGVMTGLGTLRGGVASYATAINPVGQVVGYSVWEDGQSRAFLWSKGVMTDLGTLGGNSSSASGIDPAGRVVGSSETADASRHVFLWEKGAMTDLGAFDPTGINSAGQIVGVRFVPEAQNIHAVLWAKGELTDLGTLGGPFSDAFGINPEGQVAGMSQTAAGETHATLWRPK